MSTRLCSTYKFKNSNFDSLEKQTLHIRLRHTLHQMSSYLRRLLRGHDGRGLARLAVRCTGSERVRLLQGERAARSQRRGAGTL